MSTSLPTQADSLALLVTYGVNRLHEAIKAVLKPSIARSEADPRTTFHQQFQKEAEEYDRDFHKKYHDDLNTILIFVSSPR